MKLFEYKKRTEIPDNVIRELKEAKSYIICYWDKNKDDWCVTYDATEEELCYMGAYLQKLAFGEDKNENT